MSKQNKDKKQKKLQNLEFFLFVYYFDNHYFISFCSNP